MDPVAYTCLSLIRKLYIRPSPVIVQVGRASSLRRSFFFIFCDHKRLIKISKRGNKPHQLVSREILTLIFSKTMKMFTILAAAALSTVAAKVATEPCAVIKNKDGAATQYSFKCAVET